MRIREDKYKQINTDSHYPVMLQEMLTFLEPKDGKHYLDCTFGAGGYSEAILNTANCRVTALDQDWSVKKYADNLLLKFSDKFNFIHNNFSMYVKEKQTKKYDGVILDLGVSSMQLNQGERGFSFMYDGPLDMRMSSEGLSAKDFIENVSEEELASIIYKYGDENFSRKIAKNICLQRIIEPINTTSQLARIIHGCIGNRKGKIDSATKTFQAIRIYINNELENLKSFLANVTNLLVKGGKLIIISFHSLEDAIVKHFFKENSEKHVARSKYSKTMQNEQDKWLKIITKKPVLPTRNEILLNPRSRSAKLRAAFKIEEYHAK